MHCLIAAEDNNASTIRNNLQVFKEFNAWIFEFCTGGNGLREWADRGIDVLVLSRYLPGADPIRLLPQIRMLFPSAHVVLLAGNKDEEATRAYMRAAFKAGLHNTVTGKLPGDRPYTLMLALTRPKDPVMDGYENVCEITADETPEFSAEASSDPYLSEDRDEIAPNDNPPDEYEEPHIRPRSRGRANCGVLVVSTSNKGGVGKTTSVTNIGMALGAAGIPTVIVDYNLGAPDIASFFNIKDVPGIERLSGLKHISRSQVDRLLVEVNDNLRVLPGPMNKTMPFYDGDELVAILDHLRSMYPVVICDTCPEPWSRGEAYKKIFEIVDIALAIVDQSLFSEEETKSYSPKLLSMGVKAERIRIVVNKYSPKLHSIRAVEAAFCHGFKKNCTLLPKIGALIPNSAWEKAVRDTYKGHVTALEDPVSQWHKLAKEIAGLAGYSYDSAGGALKKNNSGRPGLLSRLWGGMR